MKTKLLSFLLLISALLCASCESDPDVDNNPTTPGITPSIDDYSVLTTTIQQINQAIVSRVAYSDSGLELDWSSGDVLRIFDKNDDFYDFAYEDLDDGEDSRYFRFRSDATKPVNTEPYTVVFPASRFEEVDDPTSVTIDMTSDQVQLGNNNLDHLSDFTIMTGTTESLDDAIWMTYQTAQIKFKMTLPDNSQAFNVAKIVMTVYNEDGSENEDAFATKQSIDCTGADDPITIESSSSITLHLGLEDSDIGDDRTITAYAMLLPSEFDDCDIKVELLDTHGRSLQTRTEESTSRGFPAGYQHTALAEDSIDLYSESATSDCYVSWKQFGPGMSGNNKVAYWHPTDPKFLYVSPNMGNSYISEDGGLTYNTILTNYDAPSYKNSDGLRGIEGFTSVDFSYSDENFGFATDTGNSGIFITYDKGRTWAIQESSLDDFYEIYLSCVEVDPTNDNIWYLSAGRMRDINNNCFFTQADKHGTFLDTTGNSDCKVWRSEDRGETWTLKNSGLHENIDIETILVDPVNPTNLYLSGNYGFYRSTNSGDSWTHVKVRPDCDTSTEIDSGHEVIRSMTLHHDKSTNAVTLLLISNVTWRQDVGTIVTDGGGVFKSTDGGVSWTDISGSVKGASLEVDLVALNSTNDINSTFQSTAVNYFDWSSSEFTANVTSYPEAIMSRFTLIDVDPKDVNKIFLINNYANLSENNMKPGMLWGTYDGGNSWFAAARNGYVWNLDYENPYNTGNNNWNAIEYGRDYWQNARAYQPMGTNTTFTYLSQWMERDIYEQKAFTVVKYNCDGSIFYGQMAKIALVSYDDSETWIDVDDTVVTNSATATDGSIIGAGNSNLPGHGFFQIDAEGYRDKVYCNAGEGSLWIAYSKSTEEYDNIAAENVRFTSNEMSLSSYAIDPYETDRHYALFFRQHNAGDLMVSTDGGISYDNSGNWSVLADCTDIFAYDWSAGSDNNKVHQICLTIDEKSYDQSLGYCKDLYFCVPWDTSQVLQLVGGSVSGVGVYGSKDAGATWSCLNNGLPTSWHKYPSNYAGYDDVSGANTGAPSVTHIALNPNEPQGTLYITMELMNEESTSLWRSTDWGATWSAVTSTQFMTQPNETWYYTATANPDSYARIGMMDIHFNKSGDKAYITVGGNNASADDTYCGLWVCDVDAAGKWLTDSSVWKKIFSHPFPNRIESAIYDEDLLLLSTLGSTNTDYYNPGVYVSYNGGKAWSKINYGNGQSDRVNDIAIDYQIKGRYYVSTYGSGWYYADDPNY
ncbi:MAG: hypothetical protein SNG35_02675 [Rikenellaceae bacterium]